MAGDGGVGVDDVDEVVYEVGVPLRVELHPVGGNVAAGRRVADLAVAFELAAAVAGDCAGDAARDEVAAEDVVAAEGADGDDLGNGGGVGAVIQLLALAGRGLGGEEAAVGGGDKAAAYRVQEEREEGEDSKHVTGARAGAIGGSSGVGPYYSVTKIRASQKERDYSNWISAV